MRWTALTSFNAPLVSLLFLTSCATPVPPTGGPRDETPPEIVESVPDAGAVNVDRESLRITFSEYVDDQSFAQAFSISPAFSRTPEFVWSRRTVEVRFPEPLRENTTYVVTLDRGLRDVRGAALSRPITLAFSTGPTISVGTIAGRVVTPSDGQPAAGADVFAYDASDTSEALPERPAYRTQTDQSGAFTFEHLTERTYFVAALRDQNRNLRPDAQEPYAPPPIATIPADTTPVTLDMPWVLTIIDTTRPAPIRAQSLSRTRHRIRFSEPVSFADRDPSSWILTDSATVEQATIQSLYMHASEPRDVYVTTPPLSSDSHGVIPAGLIDSVGNPVVSNAVSFTPIAEEDTLQLRLLSVQPEGSSVLTEGMQPALRFNAPVAQEQLAGAISIEDSLGMSLSYSAITANGTDYELHPDPPLSPGMGIQILVEPEPFANLDSTVSREYTQIPRSETGEISGTVRSNEGPVLVDIAPVDVPVPVPDRRVQADTAGHFIVPNLPAGTYRLRAFVDTDEDGQWDGGRLMPYSPPESIIWRDEPTRVRARWETSLPDTLRIPTP